MSNENSRDYAGMQQMPGGEWAQTVTLHKDDVRLLAIEAKLDAILDRLEVGINVKTVAVL